MVRLVEARLVVCLSGRQFDAGGGGSNYGDAQDDGRIVIPVGGPNR